CVIVLIHELLASAQCRGGQAVQIVVLIGGRNFRISALYGQEVAYAVEVISRRPEFAVRSAESRGCRTTSLIVSALPFHAVGVADMYRLSGEIAIDACDCGGHRDQHAPPVVGIRGAMARRAGLSGVLNSCDLPVATKLNVDVINRASGSCLPV